MKSINGSLAVMLLMYGGSDYAGPSVVNAISLGSFSQLTYKSDDSDDLLEGLISGNHKDKADQKAKGPVDTMVEEAMQKAKDENPPK